MLYLQLLCGEEAALLSCNSASVSSMCWVPHLVATLLYTAPNTKLHRLHAAASHAIAATGARLGQLDMLMLAAMEGDAKKVGAWKGTPGMWGHER